VTLLVNPSDRLDLLGEKTELERVLEETPVEDVLDRASLEARLASVEAALSKAEAEQNDTAPVGPARSGRR
jgi:hypothetical protein